MKINRSQLRKIILNELFRIGKKKTGIEGYLEALRKKGLGFKSIDDVIKTKDGKFAAIGTAKSQNPNMARQMASIDAQEKISKKSNKDASKIGGSKGNVKDIDGVTYMTLIAH